MPLHKVLLLPDNEHIIDSSLYSSYQGLKNTHLSIKQAVHETFKDNMTDLILFINPRGQSNETDNQICGFNILQGSEKFQNYDHTVQSVSTSIEINNVQSNNLYKYFQKIQDQQPWESKGIKFSKQDKQYDLGLNEMIPLKYIQDQLKTQIKKVTYIVLSLNSTRNDFDYPKSNKKLADQIREISSKLYEYIDKMDQNVTILVTGNLSHAHKPQPGPLEDEHPDGNSRNANTYDKNVMNWINNPIDYHNLAQLAINNIKYLPSEQSISYWGDLFIMNIINLFVVQDYPKTKLLNLVDPRIYSYDNSTYAGLLVAAITFIKVTQ